MPKGRCISRAEWCFELGKAAKQLSPHYRLDCDHGTAIMTCWETGGSEPVYLCSSHAAELKQRSESRAAAAGRSRSGSDGDSLCGAARPKDEGATDEKPIQADRGSTPATEAASPSPPIDRRTATGDRRKADEEAAEEPPPNATAVNPGEAPAAPIAISAKVSKEVPTPKFEEPAKAQKSAGTKPPLPVPAETVPTVPAAKTVRPAKDLPVRPPARDLIFGNAAKAVVDEAIWNLPPGDYDVFRAALQQGKPAAEAAQTAGGQLAAIHRRISEFSLKLETILSASTKTIGTPEAIDKPLEQAMLEIIESDSMTDSEKDEAMQKLGALQEWAKSGLQTRFTPFEANRGLLAIGERMKWGGTNEVPERLKPAYRALFTSLKRAIQATAPDAQELHDRVINLHASKSDLLAELAAELLPR